VPTVRQTPAHRHVAVPIATSNCARLLPDSRPTSPPATTVARATSAGQTRNPGPDTADSLSDASVGG